MRIELDMYKIEYKDNNINLNYITTIYDNNVIDKLEELGISKCSGSDRVIFELDGYTLNENKDLLLQYDILRYYIFDDEDWYECRMYF